MFAFDLVQEDRVVESQAEAERAIVEKIGENTRAMLERARRGRLTPRAAAMELVLQRLGTAMDYRRPSSGGAQRADREAEPLAV